MNEAMSAQALAEFRQEVRDYIEDNLTPTLRRAGRLRTSTFQDPDSAMAWQAVLHRRGWAAPDWPVEHGGTGWNVQQRYVFKEECAAAEAPALMPMSLRMLGPTLIGRGTEAQQQHFLPRVLSGEDFWCQGYSEPGSGSDLASLQTFAADDGDDYLITGEKIWTSFAHRANWMFALVRTRREGKPQTGITFLLIPMDAPGISVRPIVNIAGLHEFNQVSFDRVRVPKANRVGEENEGWDVAKYLLQFERFSIAAPDIRRILRRLRRLAALSGLSGRSLLDDDGFRLRLAELEARTEALEASERRVLSALTAGQSPGAVSSMMFALQGGLQQQIGDLGQQAAGYYGLPFLPEAISVGGNAPPAGPEEAHVMTPTYLNDRMRTIAGGTAEVQRNVIAKAVLGL